MKRIISLLTCVVLLTAMFCNAETFSVRNGITFSDTMEDVKSKEALEIAEENENQLKTVEGTIASIENSYIEYTFDEETSLLNDIYMDFGVHIGKPEQAISAYNLIYNTLVNKYGEPIDAKTSDWYYICGSAVDTYFTNKSFLEHWGLTPSLQNKSQWVLRYDDINVKIDLIRYAPNGITTGSGGSDVIMSYRFFTNEQEQELLGQLQLIADVIADDL